MSNCTLYALQKSAQRRGDADIAVLAAELLRCQNECGRQEQIRAIIEVLASPMRREPCWAAETLVFWYYKKYDAVVFCDVGCLRAFWRRCRPLFERLLDEAGHERVAAWFDGLGDRKSTAIKEAIVGRWARTGTGTGAEKIEFFRAYELVAPAKNLRRPTHL